jgi:steroid delta-isomerase-like uncharacterized protein
MNQTRQLIQNYYGAFGSGDTQGLLDLLDDNVIHDINQGKREIGRQAFQQFLNHMNHCYREKISDLIIFVNDDGSRAAAEFTVDGIYIATDQGFPEAANQPYRIPAGAFFEIRENKITRVTNYYNIREWVSKISS